ncbi:MULTISPECIES: twin-arginine translocation signal domain-containing protein [unclassified Gordonia (in: high G+C Gram-positive bacteria)]|uniref:twin-arginine translocation signal domain-containing protein n=1 Tax=unclassified Gordonia (in: high G+C Gram-positive bacteria) TaxID=2657482 RepID=UPI001F0CF0E5|nr:twin-arginine translocation signal domain-containing protein [Gordonia sp. ABSL49_1]MCH5642421.1 twin-arginine translocation signal domain-containing protein [Gordonia sp. ABSL49_1]
MCRVSPSVSRRSVLRGGLAVTAGVTLAGVSACGDEGPSAEQLTAEALLPLARTAQDDSDTARTLIPAHADYAAALAVVADQRAAHGLALREEITRLHRDTAKQLEAAASSSTTSVAPTPGSPAVTSVDGFRGQLRLSARQAHDAAIVRSGYPAGLAGSVAASVNAMVEVQLA